MDIINNEIQNYAEKYTTNENAVLEELRQKTHSERDDDNMLSGLYQGRLLSMFSKLIRPKCILEVGTYMGYSTLCLAEGLSGKGKIITLDVEPETNEIAKEFWARTEFDDKIESHLGEATEIIPTLEETFDLVFIDADKANYSNYYDLVFPKMQVGGLIIADNVLWSGEVLDAENGDDVKKSTQALHDYNVKINADQRVSNILFAVRDGLMVSRKESE